MKKLITMIVMAVIVTTITSQTKETYRMTIKDVTLSEVYIIVDWDNPMTKVVLTDTEHLSKVIDIYNDLSLTYVGSDSLYVKFNDMPDTIGMGLKADMYYCKIGKKDYLSYFDTKKGYFVFSIGIDNVLFVIKRKMEIKTQY